MKNANLHLYERFCLIPDAESIPNKFIDMLRVINRNEKAGESESNNKDRWNLLLEAIKDKMGSYITLAVSDRTRSRYNLRMI